MKQRIAFALIIIAFAMSGTLHYREYRKSQEISDTFRIQAEIEFKRTSLMVIYQEVAEDLGLSLTVYDTDNENRTLATLMKEHCRFLDEQKETYPLDEVINSLYESSPVTVTIVDMKAGTSRSTQEWFSSVPWDALRKIDVDVYV